MNHFILAYHILTVRTVKVKSLKIKVVHHSLLYLHPKSGLNPITNISQFDEKSKFYNNIFIEYYLILSHPTA